MRASLLLSSLAFFFYANSFASCPAGFSYKSYSLASQQGTLLKEAARHYKVSLAELEDLASDPAHGDQKTVGSQLEAILATDLMQSKDFANCPFRRGHAEIEFIDCKGRQWDVKKPVLSPDWEFDTEQVVQSIVKKIRRPSQGQIVGILFDTTFLNEKFFSEVMEALELTFNDKEKERLEVVCLSEGFLTEEQSNLR